MSRCSQLDTHPNNTVYRVLEGWGLSVHKVGPSRHQKGRRLRHPLSQAPFFLHFSLRNEGGGTYSLNASRCCRDRSHAILARYCARCARFYTRVKGREGGRENRILCVRKSGINGCVIRARRWKDARILCGPTGVVRVAPREAK